jgi:hypothetical protein
MRARAIHFRSGTKVTRNNLTNQANRTAVNKVTGAPPFLHLPGDEGRHFVARIRFFGRAGKKQIR